MSEASALPSRLCIGRLARAWSLFRQIQHPGPKCINFPLKSTDLLSRLKSFALMQIKINREDEEYGVKA